MYLVHVPYTCTCMYMVLHLVLSCEQNWYFLLMKWDDFQIFRPYARDWIRPLTQLIISGPFTGLNYFVIDVIVTIMSWHQVAIPQVTIDMQIVNNKNLNGLNHCTFVVLNWDLLFSGRNTCLGYTLYGFSWQDNVEDRAMSSRLVEFVMGYVYNDTRPVYRNNLELLKTLLQVWKDRVEIPYK